MVKLSTADSRRRIYTPIIACRLVLSGERWHKVRNLNFSRIISGCQLVRNQNVDQKAERLGMLAP